jgi:hypothetical protein
VRDYSHTFTHCHKWMCEPRPFACLSTFKVRSFSQRTVFAHDACFWMTRRAENRVRSCLKRTASARKKRFFCARIDQIQLCACGAVCSKRACQKGKFPFYGANYCSLRAHRSTRTKPYLAQKTRFFRPRVRFCSRLPST